jgi:biotin carboxylase
MDYGDRDALLRTARNERIEFLIPGCTDVSYLSCAWVADQLHLPGYDTLEATHVIHKKDRFREICQHHGFPIPRSVSMRSEVSSLRFPILVKPTDSFSGRGITRVERMDDLSQGIERAVLESGSRTVVFEEFVDGNLYSHSAFLQNGKIVVDFFVNEYCTVYPYQVNSSHVCLDLGADIVQGMRQWLEAFASVLCLADGLVHTQFISDGKGFCLIEVTRRCPGDLYALLIEKSMGADYAGLYATGFCGKDLSSRQGAQERRFFSRHTVSVDRDCVFLSSSISMPQGRASFIPLKKAWEPLRAAPMDRAGIYFIEHSLSADMKASTPHLRNHVTVETLGPG